MLSTSKSHITIVVADDSDSDFRLIERAFEKLRLSNPVQRVKNGQELIDYFMGRLQNESSDPCKFGCLVLLDLNMPQKDGREALKEMKAHDQLKHVPVIVMTTSSADEDVVRSYQLGVNAYIPKPFDQKDFLDVLDTFKKFWLQIVELP